MQNLFTFLGTHRWLIAIVITALLGAWNMPAVRERVFSWIPKLPSRFQWAAPLALAMLAALGQGYLDGARGEALLEFVCSQGGQLGVMAIGFWHTWKRVIGLNLAPVAKVLAVVFFLTHLQACAGTLEESRGQIAVRPMMASPVAQTPSARCIQLSDRERIEGAAVKAGAPLTAGIGGVAIFVDDKTGKIVIASVAAAIAAGTAFVAFLSQSDAAAYIAEGCAVRSAQ
jgi:hypothetical protein